MVNQDYESSNMGTPKFEMQELPQEIGKVVYGMKVGEISKYHCTMLTNKQKEVVAIVKRSDGRTSPILTAADFRLNDDGSGIGALLDSVSNQQHRSLREKALRNITSVTEAVPDHVHTVPHLRGTLVAFYCGRQPCRCRTCHLAG